MIRATIIAALLIGGLSALIGTSTCNQIGQKSGHAVEWGLIDGCRVEMRPGNWTPVHQIQIERAA